MLNANSPQKNNQTPINIDSIPIVFSNHAKVRMQQRGINKTGIAFLLEYGRYAYQSSRHCYSISLDKSGLKKIKRQFGNLNILPKLRRLYLILSDDSVVITCAYRKG
jgi:hypothetical protein